MSIIIAIYFYVVSLSLYVFIALFCRKRKGYRKFYLAIAQFFKTIKCFCMFNFFQCELGNVLHPNNLFRSKL